MQALAKDPRRAAVETQLLQGEWWRRHNLVRSERPRLQRLLASPDFQGLVQARPAVPALCSDKLLDGDRQCLEQGLPA